MSNEVNSPLDDSCKSVADKLKQAAIDDLNPLSMHVKHIEARGPDTLPDYMKDDDKKVNELVDVFFDKFEDYRANDYVINQVIRDLVSGVKDKRDHEIAELSSKKELLEASKEGLCKILDDAMV